MLTERHIDTLLYPNQFTGKVLSCYTERDPFDCEQQPEDSNITLNEAGRILGHDRKMMGRLAKNNQFKTLKIINSRYFIDKQEAISKKQLEIYGSEFIKYGFELIGDTSKRNNVSHQSLIRHAKNNPELEGIDFIYHRGVLCYSKTYKHKRGYKKNERK